MKTKGCVLLSLLQRIFLYMKNAHILKIKMRKYYLLLFSFLTLVTFSVFYLVSGNVILREKHNEEKTQSLLKTNTSPCETKSSTSYQGIECLYPMTPWNSQFLVPAEVTDSELSIEDKQNFIREKIHFPLCSVWVSGIVPEHNRIKKYIKTIVIMGDSMMRGIFQALVANVRQLNRVYDYYYHSNAIYVLNLETGMDRLIIAIQSHEETVRRVHTINERATSLIVVFIWNPTLEERIDLEHFASDSIITPFHVYLGLHYHLLKTQQSALSLIPKMSIPNNTIWWILMSCYPDDNIPYMTIASDIFNFRNERQKALKSEFQEYAHTIDPCEISRHIPRLWDNTHFQCSLTPAVFTREGVQPPKGMKIPWGNGTCEDPLNKWIADRILNYALERHALERMWQSIFEAR